MRVNSTCRFVLPLAVSLAAPFAFAQNVAPCQTSGAMSMMSNRGSGRPYRATLTATRDQNFVDGNGIHTLSTAIQIQNAAGDEREEMSFGCFTDKNGQKQPITRVTVRLAASRTRYTWSVGGPEEKVVRVSESGVPMQRASPPSDRVTPPPVRLVPVRPVPDQTERLPAMQGQQRGDMLFHMERLGTKTISGVICDGRRTTRTVPAGQNGNTLPLVTTNEVWIARDFGFAMLSVDNDPQNGTRTVAVTALDLAEPDPSLFQPPPGYRVEKTVIPTTIMNLGSQGK